MSLRGLQILCQEASLLNNKTNAAAHGWRSNEEPLGQQHQKESRREEHQQWSGYSYPSTGKQGGYRSPTKNGVITSNREDCGGTREQMVKIENQHGFTDDIKHPFLGARGAVNSIKTAHTRSTNKEEKEDEHGRRGKRNLTLFPSAGQDTAAKKSGETGATVAEPLQTPAELVQAKAHNLRNIAARPSHLIDHDILVDCGECDLRASDVPAYLVNAFNCGDLDILSKAINTLCEKDVAFQANGADYLLDAAVPYPQRIYLFFLSILGQCPDAVITLSPKEVWLRGDTEDVLVVAITIRGIIAPHHASSDTLRGPQTKGNFVLAIDEPSDYDRNRKKLRWRRDKEDKSMAATNKPLEVEYFGSLTLTFSKDWGAAERANSNNFRKIKAVSADYSPRHIRQLDMDV